MGDFQLVYRTELSDRQLMAFWGLVQASGRGRAIGFDRPEPDGPAFCRWMRRPGVHPWLVFWRGVPVGLCYLTRRQGRSAHIHFCMLPCGTRRVDVPWEAAPAWKKEGSPRENPAAQAPAYPADRAATRATDSPRAPGMQSGCATSARTPARLPLIRAAALYGMASLLWEAPEQGFVLDTLIGVTPQNSGPALNLVRSLGGREVATVPGLCWLEEAGLNVPGVITVFDRNAVPRRAAHL